MPSTITRLQMETRARRKSDTVDDAHIEDDHLHDECNDLIAQVWREILVVDPDRLVTMTTLSTTAGTFAYTLPSDFMSIRRLDWVDGTQRRTIEPAPMLELDMSSAGNGNQGDVVYRLIGGGQSGTTERIHLRPDPGTTTYELWYAIAPPVLSTDGATLDCRFGEHAYVIAGLAAFCMERQQDDSSPFRREQGAALEHVRTMARRRDVGRAKKITDVRSMRDGIRRYPRP